MKVKKRMLYRFLWKKLARYGQIPGYFESIRKKWNALYL